MAAGHADGPARAKCVISLYQPDELNDGPRWRTQVDRVRMDFSGDRLEDYRREMLQARECGISAFAYNANPARIYHFRNPARAGASVGRGHELPSDLRNGTPRGDLG